MTRWLSFVGAPGTSVRCNCALAERQRIFDLERRVAGMPEVTRGEDGFWEPPVEEWGYVELTPSKRVLAPYGDCSMSPQEARWLAAALLAAASEAEG